MSGSPLLFAFSARRRGKRAIRPSLLMALVDSARFRALARRLMSGRRRRVSIHRFTNAFRAA